MRWTGSVMVQDAHNFLGLEPSSHVLTRSAAAAKAQSSSRPRRSSLASCSFHSSAFPLASPLWSLPLSIDLVSHFHPPWLKPSAATHQNLNKTPCPFSIFFCLFPQATRPSPPAPIAMSRALLRRRLLPFSRAAASSRAASSYTSRGFSSGPSRYAASTSAAAGQADAASAAQAGAAGPAQAEAAAGAAQAGAEATEPLAGAGEQGASTPTPEARGRWGLLKYGALAAVSAALGGVGYVSYGAIPRSLVTISLLGRLALSGFSLCSFFFWRKSLCFRSSDFLLFCSASSVFAG